MVIIYEAINSANGKSYIGFTAMSLEKRRRLHYNHANTGSPYKFHRALITYDLGAWKWEIIAKCNCREDAARIEREKILEHNTFETGYNSTTGGERGWSHTVETRQKMSVSTKQNLPCTAFKTGHTPWNKGKKGVQVAWNKGVPHTREAREKMSGPRQPLKIVECPFCSRAGGINSMYRHHFEHCKQLSPLPVYLSRKL